MANIRTDKSIRFEWPEGNTSERVAKETAASLGKMRDARFGVGSGQPSNGRPASFIRRALWWSGYLVAWIVVLSLGAVALLRIFYHDATFPLIWLNAFTRYVYLPAYLCAAWALWQRRWMLLAAGSVVVGCHLFWLGPDFLRDRRFAVPIANAATATEASPTLRVFFANVAASNDEHAALLNEIAAANPDVIVLVEFSWPWHITFKTAPVMAPYKYGAGWLQSHIGSVNVFSKLPLKKETQNWISGRAMHTADIEFGGRTLRLVGLHGPRPIDSPKYNYRGYWDQMIPLLKDETGPVVIVGDFNATEHSRVYDVLTADRLRSAHDDRGRGYATTWPNRQEWLPPIRIDQALLSPEIECLEIREGEGRGSDHKPLILDVRIRNSEAAAESPSTGERA